MKTDFLHIAETVNDQAFLLNGTLPVVEVVDVVEEAAPPFYMNIL